MGFCSSPLIISPHQSGVYGQWISLQNSFPQPNFEVGVLLPANSEINRRWLTIHRIQFRYLSYLLIGPCTLFSIFKDEEIYFIKSLDLFTLSLYNERKPSKRLDGFQNGILLLRFTVRTEFANFTSNSCFDSVAARSNKFTRIVNFLVFV